jgi:hypothetical protein
MKQRFFFRLRLMPHVPCVMLCLPLASTMAAQCASASIA